MKKLFSLLLVLFMVLLLTGCGCARKEEAPKEEETVLADDELMFDEILYKFNKEESHYNIKYKVAENMRLWDSGNAYNYFSQKIEGKEEKDAFIVRVFYYKNKDVKYAIKDTTANEYDSKEDVELDGRKYTKVHFQNPGGAQTYLFYYKNKKDVYAYCFTSTKEVERLESIFLRLVEYK